MGLLTMSEMLSRPCVNFHMVTKPSVVVNPVALGYRPGLLMFAPSYFKRLTNKAKATAAAAG